MKKLPKLPKLHSRKRSVNSMPALPNAAEIPVRPEDKVRPRSGRIEDTRIGRWFEVDDITAWGGRCAQCGRAVPAIELHRFIPPFGTRDDEIWACGECRKETTLSRKSGGPAGRKARPIEELKERQVGNYRDQLEAMMGSLIAGNIGRINGFQEGIRQGTMCKWPDDTPDRMKAAWTTVGHIGNQLLKLKEGGK